MASLHWTPALEKRAAKARARLSIPATGPLPDAASAMAMIRAQLPPEARAFEWLAEGLGSSCDPDATREVIRRYQGEASGPLDVHVEAVAMALLPNGHAGRYGGQAPELQDLLLQHWVAREGLAFAVEALVRSTRLHHRRLVRSATSANHGALFVSDTPAEASRERHRRMSFSRHRSDRWLVAHIEAASGRERAQLLALAEALSSEGSLEARALVATLFLEARWVNGYLRARSQTTLDDHPGAFPYLSRSALLRATDLSALSAYLERLGPEELDVLFNAHYKPPPTLVLLAQRHRDELVPALCRLLAHVERSWSPGLSGARPLSATDAVHRDAAKATLEVLANVRDCEELVAPCIRLLEGTRGVSKSESLRPLLDECLLGSAPSALPKLRTLAAEPWAAPLVDALERVGRDANERTAGASPLAPDDFPAPARPWKRPAGWSIGMFPPLLDGSGRPIRPEVGERVVDVLRENDPSRVAQVRLRLDVRSVSGLLLALVHAWDDGRLKEGWALTVIAPHADDPTTDALCDLVARWAASPSWKRAIIGIQVLREIGTHRARIAIDALRGVPRYEPVRAAAQDAFACAA